MIYGNCWELMVTNGNSVRPDIRFRSIRPLFSVPIQVRFWKNTDQIDRIFLDLEKKCVFFKLGCRIVVDNECLITL